LVRDGSSVRLGASVLVGSSVRLGASVGTSVGFLSTRGNKTSIGGLRCVGGAEGGAEGVFVGMTLVSVDSGVGWCRGGCFGTTSSRNHTRVGGVRGGWGGADDVDDEASVVGSGVGSVLVEGGVGCAVVVSCGVGWEHPSPTLLVPEEVLVDTLSYKKYRQKNHDT